MSQPYAYATAERAAPLSPCGHVSGPLRCDTIEPPRSAPAGCATPHLAAEFQALGEEIEASQRLIAVLRERLAPFLMPRPMDAPGNGQTELRQQEPSIPLAVEVRSMRSSIHANNTLLKHTIDALGI